MISEYVDDATIGSNVSDSGSTNGISPKAAATTATAAAAANNNNFETSNVATTTTIVATNSTATNTTTTTNINTATTTNATSTTNSSTAASTAGISIGTSSAAIFACNNSQKQPKQQQQQQSQLQHSNHLPLHSNINDQVKTTGNTTSAVGGHNLSTASSSSSAFDLSLWHDLCRTCGKPSVDLATLFVVNQDNNNTSTNNNNNNNNNNMTDKSNNDDSSHSNGIGYGGQQMPPAVASKNIPVNHSTMLHHSSATSTTNSTNSYSRPQWSQSAASSAAASTSSAPQPSTLSSSSSAAVAAASTSTSTASTAAAAEAAAAVAAALDSAAFCDQNSSFMDTILQEMQIWNLRIKSNDGLPQRICPKCRAQFSMIGKFRRKCLKVQIRFRTLYDELRLDQQNNQEKQQQTTQGAYNASITTTPNGGLMLPPTIIETERKAQALERLLPDIGNDSINDKREGNMLKSTAKGNRTMTRRSSISNNNNSRHKTSTPTTTTTATPPSTTTTTINNCAISPYNNKTNFDEEALLETHVIYKMKNSVSEMHSHCTISAKLTSDMIMNNSMVYNIADYNKIEYKDCHENVEGGNSSMKTIDIENSITSMTEQQHYENNASTTLTTNNTTNNNNNNNNNNTNNNCSTTTTAHPSTFITKAALKEYDDISPITSTNSSVKQKQLKRKLGPLSFMLKKRNLESTESVCSSTSSSSSSTSLTTSTLLPKSATISSPRADALAENKLKCKTFKNDEEDSYQCQQEMQIITAMTIKPCSIRLRAIPSRDLEAIKNTRTLDTLDVGALAARDVNISNTNINSCSRRTRQHSKEHNNYEMMIMLNKAKHSSVGEANNNLNDHSNNKDQAQIMLNTPANPQDNEKAIKNIENDDDNDDNTEKRLTSRTSRTKSISWQTKAELEAARLISDANSKSNKSNRNDESKNNDIMDTTMQMPAKEKGVSENVVQSDSNSTKVIANLSSTQTPSPLALASTSTSCPQSPESSSAVQVKLILERKRGARYKCKHTKNSTQENALMPIKVKRRSKRNRNFENSHESCTENSKLNAEEDDVEVEIEVEKSKYVNMNTHSVEKCAEFNEALQQSVEEVELTQQAVSTAKKEAHNKSKQEIENETFNISNKMKQKNIFDNNLNEVAGTTTTNENHEIKGAQTRSLKRKMIKDKADNETASSKYCIRIPIEKICDKRLINLGQPNNNTENIENFCELQSKKADEAIDNENIQENSQSITFMDLEEEAMQLAELFSQKLIIKEQTTEDFEQQQQQQQPMKISSKINIMVRIPLTSLTEEFKSRLYSMQTKKQADDNDKNIENSTNDSVEKITENETTKCETTSKEENELGFQEAAATAAEVKENLVPKVSKILKTSLETSTPFDIEDSNENNQQQTEQSSNEINDATEQNKNEISADHNATPSLSTVSISNQSTATKSEQNNENQTNVISATELDDITSIISKPLIAASPEIDADLSQHETLARSTSKINDFINDFQMNCIDSTDLESRSCTPSSMFATFPTTASTILSQPTTPMNADNILPPMSASTNQDEMDDVETTLNGILNEMQDQHIYTPVSNHTDDFFSQSVYSPFSEPPDTPLGTGSMYADSPATSIGGIGSSMNEASSPYMLQPNNQATTCFDNNFNPTTTTTTKLSNDESTTQSELIGFQNDIPCFENIEMNSMSSIKSGGATPPPPSLLPQPNNSTQPANLENANDNGVFLNGDSAKECALRQLLEDFEATEREQFKATETNALVENSATVNEVVTQWTNTSEQQVPMQPIVQTREIEAIQPIQQTQPSQPTQPIEAIQSTQPTTFYFNANHQLYATHTPVAINHTPQNIPEQNIPKTNTAAIDTNKNYIEAMQKVQQQSHPQRHHHQQQQQQQPRPQQQQQIMIVIPQEYLDKGGNSNAPQLQQVYTPAPQPAALQYRQQIQQVVHPQSLQQTTVLTHQQRPQFLISPRIAHINQQGQYYMSPPMATVTANNHNRIQYYPTTSTIISSPTGALCTNSNIPGVLLTSPPIRPRTIQPTPTPQPTQPQPQPQPKHQQHPQQQPKPVRQFHNYQPHREQRAQKVNLTCRFCHKRPKFTNNLDYSNHIIALHPEQRPFNCPHCPMHFVRRAQRQQHILECHNAKRFQCAQCGDSFAAQRSLDFHLQRAHAPDGQAAVTPKQQPTHPPQQQQQQQRLMSQSPCGGTGGVLSVRQQPAPWRDSSAVHTNLPTASPTALVHVEDVHLHVSDESGRSKRAIDIPLDVSPAITEPTADTQACEPKALCSPDCDDESSDIQNIAQESNDAQMMPAEDDDDYEDEEFDDEEQCQEITDQAQSQRSHLSVHVTMPSPEQTEPDSTTTLRRFRKRRANGSKQTTVPAKSQSQSQTQPQSQSQAQSQSQSQTQAHAQMQIQIQIQTPTTTQTTNCTTTTTTKATNDMDVTTERLLRNSLNCLFCEEQFTNDLALRKHQQLVHGNQMTMPYICAICKRGFRMRTALQRHMETHEAVGRPYECNECHVRFPRPSHLTLHKLTVHALLKPHACPECGKQFGTESAVKTHMKFHGEKKIACDMCERKYFLMKDMRKHRRSVHFGVRFYKCDFCPSSFLHHSRFSDHMKTHIPLGMYIEENLPSNKTLNQNINNNNSININNANDSNNSVGVNSCSEFVEHNKFINIESGNVEQNMVASAQIDSNEFKTHEQQQQNQQPQQSLQPQQPQQHEQNIDYTNLIMAFHQQQQQQQEHILQAIPTTTTTAMPQ